MSLGMQFLKAVVMARNPAPLRDVKTEFFVKHEKEAFKFLRNHVKRHGEIPRAATMTENGHRLSRAEEPAGYYAGKLRERYVYTLIASAMPDISSSMRGKDPAAALTLIRELSSLGGHVLEPDSFSTLEIESVELMEEYARIKASGEPDIGIPLGWPTMDRLTMGMQGGDLVVIAGRPNVGKTWLMMWMAYMAWCSGMSVGILSMEMTKKQIVRRFVSFITGANPNLIRAGALSVWAEELLRGAVRGLRRRPPVWINSSDMQHKNTALAEKILGEHSPDILLIDAAYRLQPNEARNNMVGHERNAQVVGELKQYAIHYDRPIVAVNQYNRSVKSRSGQAAELGSAAGTDSWEQDSSIFLGLRHGPPPFEESSRVIDMTKNREGGLGTCRVNFGFSPVNFEELQGDDDFTMAEDSEWQE
jgi:replicative DNA helicase